ncbi:MAG: carbamoyltransferase C-terminal domain-containing protein [Polyangiaceae bacterium]
MKILGLCTMGTSAAAIVEDGRVVAAIEEERLTRLKNDGGFPHRAIDCCLDVAGATLSDIDEVAVYWQPWRVLGRAAAVAGGALAHPSHAAARLRRVAQLFRPSRAGHGTTEYPEQRGSWFELFRVGDRLSRHPGTLRGPLRFLDHHASHAMSACPISGFESALCLSYDGGGEEHSTAVFTWEKGRLTRLRALRWPNSLGHFYSAMTGFLGFRMLEGEYKMMGLAPYGTPRFKDALLAGPLTRGGDGTYRLDRSVIDYHAALEGRFPADLVRLLGEPRRPGEPFTDHHRDVAASVQSVFEEVLLDIVRWARGERPDLDRLCITGGCGLNVTANGRLLREGVVSRIFVPPAPHDAGCAVGAAVHATLDRAPFTPIRMPTPYLGRAYSPDAVALALRAGNLPVPEPLSDADLAERTADALARGEIVAWFQGASELGPRALGNRSFLADPRRDEIREAINAKIKKRELFRPFAPSCKIEVASTFFELDQPSPYMNIVARVRNEQRAVIPAVTHVDGSARVHTVDRGVNPLYWSLLDAFERRTGVGVLLNTSFNIQEPIVESPADAVDCFLRSSVDWLAIGPYLVRRAAPETPPLTGGLAAP